MNPGYLDKEDSRDNLDLRSKSRKTESGEFQIDEPTKQKLVQQYQESANLNPYGQEINQEAYQDVSEKFNVLNAEDLQMMRMRPFSAAAHGRNQTKQQVSTADS